VTGDNPVPGPGLRCSVSGLRSWRDEEDATFLHLLSRPRTEDRTPKSVPGTWYLEHRRPKAFGACASPSSHRASVAMKPTDASRSSGTWSGRWPVPTRSTSSPSDTPTGGTGTSWTGPSSMPWAEPGGRVSGGWRFSGGPGPSSFGKPADGAPTSSTPFGPTSPASWPSPSAAAWGSRPSCPSWVASWSPCRTSATGANSVASTGGSCG